MSLVRRPFGRTAAGEPVECFTLESPAGLRAEVIDFGGAVVSLRVPDRRGELADVVLGHADLAGYETNAPHLGVLVGRCANRIRGARFELDGRTVLVTPNRGVDHLHGGRRGLARVVWRAEPLEVEGGAGLALHHTSPDGDEGYPGTLECRVEIRLEGDALAFRYRATTDAPTPVNLTHHGYWNLAGHEAGSVLDHELRLAAASFTPMAEDMIPTGEVRSVDGTPFDFRTATRVGPRIDGDDPQLALAGGYDHNYVLDGEAGPLRPVAWLRDRRSGRTLELQTTSPGVQLYTANSLDVPTGGKGGARYGRRDALCLETQLFPNAVNEPAFASPILRPGEVWEHETRHRFGTDAG